MLLHILRADFNFILVYSVNRTSRVPRLYSIIKQLCNVYLSQGNRVENCLGLRNNSSLFPYDINNVYNKGPQIFRRGKQYAGI